jgi:hypothetical protein
MTPHRPPRDTLKDTAAGVFAADFSGILTAENVQFFGRLYHFLPFFGPLARYWEGNFFHSRVRKPENFLGINGFLPFPRRGSEKI